MIQHEALADDTGAEGLSVDLQKEIDRRVTEKLTEMLAAMEIAKGASGSDASMGSVLQAFAENMAAISAQANNKIVIPPGVKRRREAGYARMVELIKAARSNGDRPEYGLNKTIQLVTHDGPVLLDPVWRNEITKKAEETVFVWPGVPCDAMSPKNEVAREIFAAFMESNANVEGIGVRDDTIGITAKGRVVYGSVVHTKEEVRMGESMSRDMPDNGFRMVQGNALQRSVHKRVLGTTAEPFVESAV